MALTVKYDNPQLAPGEIVGAGGIALTNGESVDVDEEAETLFVETNGKSVEDFFANDPHVTVSGSGTVPTPEPESVAEENTTITLPGEEGGGET